MYQSNVRVTSNYDCLTNKEYWLKDGWNVKDEDLHFVLYVKNNSKIKTHIILFLLTFWTFGLCNMIYHFSSKEQFKIVYSPYSKN